ncbi:hypothetical protein DFS34DRAFT_455906 [Phlyctochytrium arcticum]|nr:hypothetical protein DFS34DRAFT_455906 [Phlyctochytrium arcticum]
MTFDPDDRHRLSPSFQPDIDQQRMPASSSPHQQRKEKARMGKETTFGMSGNEWRHLAGQNFTDQWRDAWKKEVAAVAGVSISTLTSNITTPKTVILQTYLTHLQTTFRSVDFLTTYHSKEHRWNFYKHRQSQKALSEVVRRDKGDDLQRDKSRVIVAFGNGEFGGRKGSRRAPLKKIKNHLSTYVTLVLIDEYRTSRACSGCLKEECWQDDESQTPPPVPSVTDDPDDVEELRWDLDEDDDNNTAKDDKQKEW